MGGGLGSSSRYKARQARAKKAAKKLQKLVGRLPTVTEEDLLAFQISHFGDDSQPKTWFVSPERALNFKPEYEEEDDGLGYYPDGVKRTLTDEQIAIFRRRELWELEQQKLKAKDYEAKVGASPEKQATAKDSKVPDNAEHAAAPGTGSPDDVLSDEYNSNARDSTMSMDVNDDGIALAASLSESTPARDTGATARAQKPTDDEKNPDDTSETSNSNAWEKKRRRRDIPWGHRNKRKWEGYITDKDPVEGSLTARRVARELDEQHAETVEMDY